ncbi:hypothetical protein FJZ53_00170 [Candidatus Woesearchaeota archaeon]|nr:hypothetical protein [Candidatus Woesearchaeota archaeon]
MFNQLRKSKTTKGLVGLLSPLILASGIYFSTPSYTQAAQCGNGKCEEGETPLNCPQDCSSPIINGLAESTYEEGHHKSDDGRYIGRWRVGQRIWAWSQGKGENDLTRYAIRDANCDGIFEEKYSPTEEFEVPPCAKNK